MLNPMALALASGCGYVARGFSGDIKQLTKLYTEGIRHPGFALIDVFSPCVTFNKQNTYDWFRKRVYKLEDKGHDPTDFHAAMNKALEWGDHIPLGLFYRASPPRASIDGLDPALQPGPLVHQPLGLSKQQRAHLVGEFM
jgi:2-oxoglutarate ferredoxin oxidoreductase subunit beta